MQKIEVKQQFTLTRDDHTTVHFAPGTHLVEDDIANHWYVKDNSTPAGGGEEADPSTVPDHMIDPAAVPVIVVDGTFPTDEQPARRRKGDR